MSYSIWIAFCKFPFAHKLIVYLFLRVCSSSVNSFIIFCSIICCISYISSKFLEMSRYIGYLCSLAYIVSSWHIMVFRKDSICFFDALFIFSLIKFYTMFMQSFIYIFSELTFFLEIYPLNNFYIFTALSYLINICCLFFFIYEYLLILTF